MTNTASTHPIVRDAELRLPAEGSYGMGMPSSTTQWTREMVLALPDDGNRYELLDGELLVTPAPRARHQDAVVALLYRLTPYVREHRFGHLGCAPADLQLQISSWREARLPSRMSTSCL